MVLVSIKLSEASITNIIQLIAAVLVGSGLVVTAQSATSSTDSSANVEYEIQSGIIQSK